MWRSASKTILGNSNSSNTKDQNLKSQPQAPVSAAETVPILKSLIEEPSATNLINRKSSASAPDLDYSTKTPPNIRTAVNVDGMNHLKASTGQTRTSTNQPSPGEGSSLNSSTGGFGATAPTTGPDNVII